LVPGATVTVLGLPGGQVLADDETIAAAVSAAIGLGCLVTLGSGTITDLGKLVSFETGVPLVAVQTAASVNGFSDDLSVVLRAGAKRTVASTYPAALVIDHRVLAAAPVALSRAGLGECLGALVAPADWLLAATVGADPTYDPEIVSSYHRPAAELMGIAGGIGRRQQEAVGALARLLTLGGLAMGRAGRTAPLSGTEHAISHLLDMAAGKEHGLHGSQVGVAAVVAACIWELALDRLDAERAAGIPDDAAIAGSLVAALTRLDPGTIDECWSDYRVKPALWRATPPDPAALASLPEQASLWLGAPAEMAAVLAAADAPTRFSELDPPVDANTARWAVANAHLLRSRFTILDLVVFTGGNPEQLVGDALDRAAELGGGL
jgi:glycerol-1-phosphate dehydrogenase [NAD(P)+]